MKAIENPLESCIVSDFVHHQIPNNGHWLYLDNIVVLRVFLSCIGDQNFFSSCGSFLFSGYAYFIWLFLASCDGY
ncbi:hypothetical protein MTR67_020773 [Solanum verrucosum]|uniref:Uncharacterized protein n=1 Tax=Solanum verrucosum TaxID=315347 RepID=A0AAF0QQE2_SOLVR|nr:hypothetical protein MTR67_020773 [Solanum verrucosum]